MFLYNNVVWYYVKFTCYVIVTNHTLSKVVRLMTALPLSFQFGILMTYGVVEFCFHSDKELGSSPSLDCRRKFYIWLLGHIRKISCFPSQLASLLESASRKILLFISLKLTYLALQLIVFWWKQIHCPSL